MKSILLAAAFLGSLCWAGTNPYNIIPEPVNVTTTSGTTKNLKIVHEQKVAGLGNEGYAMKLTPGGRGTPLYHAQREGHGHGDPVPAPGPAFGYS